ncbi:hypothetical protein PSCICO_44530 [Pseudomonas cichorii]|uniref:Uncharacterized protein n=2 Tax=Pseudomonas syringae group TaxID=136849 RepID=A0A3M4W4A8_PSECI|nr:MULTISPECIES: hypothetical protein [Pseudomonas]AHF66150.1 hypothetical protein PCH70_09970 [Pseudomonas cichorii JBC1]MDO7930448.1 hypothetical protein [Pseudomonas sp. KFB-138]QVE18109.1 hypothetical protein KGD89_04970 [Pseudomonas cichorii]RMR58002.1 hypothetical protein ALP84_00715 [Pseudomonas cichorii]SDP28274.1 hypothetical protein SAMN05216599_12911 [Pseudomonas cichorii]
MSSEGIDVTGVTVEINTPENPSETTQFTIPLSDGAVSESVTQPYIREANERAELSALIANKGFTLVLPGFEDGAFHEVLMTFSTPDNSGKIISTRLNLEQGKDSIDAVKQNEILKAFKPGDKARIQVFLSITPDIWVAGKESIEYSIV